MNRFFGALLLTACIAIGAGACNDEGGTYPYGSGSSPDCAAYTACGSCTPVSGCGWCFAPGGGGGACASSPDQCVSEAGEFTWTWNASGCPAVDASVAPPGDAGATTAPPSEAGPGSLEAGKGASDAARAPAESGAGDGAAHD